MKIYDYSMTVEHEDGAIGPEHHTAYIIESASDLERLFNVVAAEAIIAANFAEVNPAKIS